MAEAARRRVTGRVSRFLALFDITRQHSVVDLLNGIATGQPKVTVQLLPQWLPKHNAAAEDIMKALGCDKNDMCKYLVDEVAGYTCRKSTAAEHTASLPNDSFLEGIEEMDNTSLYAAVADYWTQVLNPAVC